MGEAIDLYQILHFVSKYEWFVHAVCFTLGTVFVSRTAVAKNYKLGA